MLYKNLNLYQVNNCDSTPCNTEIIQSNTFLNIIYISIVFIYALFIYMCVPTYIYKIKFTFEITIQMYEYNGKITVTSYTNNDKAR